MDLTQVREKWVNYNLNLIEKFKSSSKISEDSIKNLQYFATEYLIDFMSELDEDPENEDGGILTLDTVTSGYIDAFLGRWYIQENENITKDDMENFVKVLYEFFQFLKKNGLYKERAKQFTKMEKRLEDSKKYQKRLKEYQEIQKQKEDEENYLDLMREWEYEDL